MGLDLINSITRYIDDETETSSINYTIDLDALSFPEQISFILDTSQRCVACCSRRAGKSYGVALKLIYTCIMYPGYANVYITKTRDAGKDILWDVLKHMANIVGISHNDNNMDLIMRFPTLGSSIHFESANDENAKEKLRGRKFKLAVIDEAQMFGSYLYDFIQQVLDPTVRGCGGQIVLTGTPNQSISGYFMDLVKEARVKVFKWTWRDNKYFVDEALRNTPSLTCADDILKQALIDYNLPVDHPIIQREWFGNLVRSDNMNVYDYNAERNSKPVPTNRNATWRYVLGVDLGFEDSSAIVVLGFDLTKKECYLIEETKFNHVNITEVCNRITSLHKKYSPYYSVMDAGALGKMIQSELNTRNSFFLDAAEKTRKAEFIALVNDEFRLGRVHIPDSSNLAKEMVQLVWNEDKYNKGVYVERDGLDNHLCDAFLYAFRKAHHFLSKEPAPKISKYSEQWLYDQDHQPPRDPAYD